MEKFTHHLATGLYALMIGIGVWAVVTQDIWIPTRSSQMHLTGVGAIVFGIGMICLGSSHFLWLRWPMADEDFIISYHRMAFIAGFVLVIAGGFISSRVWSG